MTDTHPVGLPDYTTYTLDELHAALEQLDAERFPDWEVALMREFERRADARPADAASANSHLEGLGGWLGLVGLGVVLSPFRILFVVASVILPIFSDGVWASLTTPGSDAYHVMWGPVIIFELVSNLTMAAVSVWMIVLFFRTSPRFPKVFIGFCLASGALILVDALLVKIVLPEIPILDDDTLGELGRTAVQCMIWIPYMLVSKRVKATFVDRSVDEAAVFA